MTLLMTLQRLLIPSIVFFAFFLRAESPTSQTFRVWIGLMDNKEHLELLISALDATKDEYGPYELLPTKQYREKDLEQALFAGQDVDIVSLPPSKEREKRLLPVFVPLTRGLLGMRVCVIHPKFKNLFSSLTQLEDFNKQGVTMVVGSDWQDRKIIEAAGLKTQTRPLLIDLFALIDESSPKCFSRSLNEIDGELEKIEEFNLTTDSFVLLDYDLPSLFFVTPKKPELANRISKGLERLIQNKDYFKIFWRHYRSVFKIHHVRSRKILHLPNPNLSDEVRRMKKRKNLWIPSIFERQPATQ